MTPQIAERIKEEGTTFVLSPYDVDLLMYQHRYQAFIAGAKRGYEIAMEEDEWIRVEDGLPENKTREVILQGMPYSMTVPIGYLVHFDDGNILLCMWDEVDYGSKEWHFRIAFDEGIRFGEAPEPKPTHWQPLPQKPKP